MKNLQFNPYQCGVRWGGLGLKSLNLSLPCFVVRDYNLTLSLPHHLCGAGKTCMGRSWARWVKWGGAKLSSLRYLPFVQVLGVHVRCKSHYSPRWSRHWHGPKHLSFSQHFSSFAYSYFSCRVQTQPCQHSHMPCNVQKSN